MIFHELSIESRIKKICNENDHCLKTNQYICHNQQKIGVLICNAIKMLSDSFIKSRVSHWILHTKKRLGVSGKLLKLTSVLVQHLAGQQIVNF